MANASLEDLYSSGSKSPASSQVDSAPRSETEPVRQETAATEARENTSDTPSPVSKPDTNASTGGKKDAPPASEDDDQEIPNDVHGLLSAVKAERNKRNDWKKKAVEYETKLRQRETEAQELAEYRTLVRQLQQQQLATQQAQQQSQPQQAQQARPDPYTDPEGALAYQERMIAAALQQRDQQTQQEIYRTRAELSREAMMASKPDYDEVEAAFAEVAKSDPNLREQLLRSPNPARFAYETGKQIQLHRQIQEAGSLEAYAERMAEKRLAEMQANAAKAATAPIQSRTQTPVPAPPQTLAGVPSVTPRNRPASTGHTPLADLYKT